MGIRLNGTKLHGPLKFHFGGFYCSLILVKHGGGTVMMLLYIHRSFVVIKHVVTGHFHCNAIMQYSIFHRSSFRESYTYKYRDRGMIIWCA